TNRWLNPELKEHTTEILLDETDAPVSPGDSAEVEILIDHLTDVLAVPVQCVYSRGPKNFVFRRDGRTAEPVEVELGASNESFVEIASGLKPGDEVLMSADERLLAKLPAVDISAAEIAGRSADAKRRGPAHNSAAGRRPAKPPTGRTSRASGGGKPATP
ncbi:MAG: efflux RND transporter periplasmic adaptor subunit, partial [Planctomycetota bacterium]